MQKRCENQPLAYLPAISLWGWRLSCALLQLLKSMLIGERTVIYFCCACCNHSWLGGGWGDLSCSRKIDTKLAVDTGAIDLIGLEFWSIWCGRVFSVSQQAREQHLDSFSSEFSWTLREASLGVKKKQPVVTQRFLAVMAALKTGD